jgi:membrane-associated protein
VAMDLMQFFDMVIHIDKTLGTMIAHYGTLVYVMLSAIVFCETGLVVTPFLPGDSLLFIAGAFCATGSMNIWLLMGLLITCAVVGNTVNYWIGLAIGHKVFVRDYKWIDRNALKKTHYFFEKHGGKTIIIARFIPIIRTFAPFVAGVSEMTFVRFQLFNIFGALMWVVGLVVGGYFFGNIPIIRNHLNMIVLLGIGAAVIPLMMGGIWKLYRKVTEK